jgi:hypothetical protein
VSSIPERDERHILLALALQCPRRMPSTDASSAAQDYAVLAGKPGLRAQQIVHVQAQSRGKR